MAALYAILGIFKFGFIELLPNTAVGAGLCACPEILSRQNPIASGDNCIISFGNSNICDANIGGTARRPSPTMGKRNGSVIGI